MPVIYIDVLLALNLLIDFMLLSATSRILRNPCRRWRMVMGALFGAACSLMIFIPDMPFVMNMAMKLVSAAIIILITYPWCGVLTYIKQIVVFFVISTLFAGLAAALWFFAAPTGFYVFNGVVYYDVSPVALTALTLICYGIICLFERFTRKRVPGGAQYRLVVETESGTVGVKALLDTGHHLTENFSGKPVIIVLQSAIEPALSEDYKNTILSFLSYSISPEGVSSSHQMPIRLISYQTVGGAGLLPAFCPKQVTVVNDRGISRDVTGVYVAVCPQIGRGEYQALFGSDIGDLFRGLPDSLITKKEERQTYDIRR